MDMLDSQTWIILGVVAVLALLALAAWLFYGKKQSYRLEQRFGPEYGRTVDTLGSRTKAEAELKARESRVERLAIVALAPADAARFSQAWTALQGRFVDNPKGVVVQADQLVRELMAMRGYPVADLSAVRPTFQSITRRWSTTTGRRHRVARSARRSRYRGIAPGRGALPRSL
jgi:hypothetical protein